MRAAPRPRKVTGPSVPIAAGLRWVNDLHRGNTHHVHGSWRLPARFDQVATARRTVRTLLSTAGTSDYELFLMELATGELLANAVEHGTGSFVDLKLQVLFDGAVLVVKNEGSPFERHAVDMTTMGFGESGRGLALLVAMGFAISVECGRGRCTVTSRMVK